MSEPQHTSGPWSVEWPDEDEQHQIYHDERELHDPYAKLSSGDWFKFAKVIVFVQGNPDEQGKANARLIAASPDLLEACQAFVDRYEYLAKLWGEEGVSRGVADKIRAAIKKAKGE